MKRKGVTLYAKFESKRNLDIVMTVDNYLGYPEDVDK
jgi:hypothetical protein